jgi:hypothetical protein
LKHAISLLLPEPEALTAKKSAKPKSTEASVEQEGHEAAEPELHNAHGLRMPTNKTDEFH